MRLELTAPRIVLPHRSPAGPPLDISVGPGECFVLLGRSGSGKTLLCRYAAGLEPGAPLLASPPPRVPEAQPGFVPQGGRENLVPGWSVGRHLAWLGLSVEATTSVAAELGLDLPANLSARATELSEGMIRRLLLALVLAGDPSLLIVDEPTTGLDPLSRELLTKTLAGSLARGVGVLLSTHDVRVASAIGTRFALVEHGAIVAVAPKLEPTGPFAAWLGDPA